MDGFDSHLDGYYDVENQLPRYLRECARERFDATNARKAAIDSVEEHEQRADRVREAFLTEIGGLPDERTPLNAQTTGPLEHDGYTVERVVFESLPSFHVTANLYRPDGEGPFPGVLFLCGHSPDAKAGAAYQQACIELAKNGFLTLAIDPIGQGERVQSYDPATGEMPRQNTAEHTYLGQQCAVAGASLARYFVWDMVRALDYLESRPDVDESRIGATGNSGGGMQTGFLLLVDDRVDAAMPCCFVTSREAYMETGQAQDGEQIVHRAIDHGIDYDDFLSAFAPKPVRIGAAQSDFLCIEGTKRSLERARDVYDRYDCPENVDLAVSDRTHGLAPPLRQAMVNWFREHLRDAPPDFETGDPDTEDEETLRCTGAGQVHGEYADETHVVDLNRQFVRDRYDDAGSAPDIDDHEAHAAEIRERVIDRLDLDRPDCDLRPRRIAREVDEDRGVRWAKVFFYAEPDVLVAGVLAEALEAPETVRPTVVLPDHGTDDFADREERVATLARERGLAMAFDPRGVGAVQARDVNTPQSNGGEYFDYHGTEYKLGSDALMLGTSLFGMRVHDVLQAREYLERRVERTDGAREHIVEGAFGDDVAWTDAADTAGGTAGPVAGEGGSPVEVDGFAVEGTGVGALHALYAAAAESRFRSVRLVDLPYSFHEMATNEAYGIDFRLRVHGLVGDCDVPQLLPALADREVAWEGTDPAMFR